MIQFFRINDPYRMIFVFLTLVIIRSAWMIWGLPISVPELKWLLVGQRLGDGFVMYRDLYDHTGPLAAGVYEMLDVIFGRSRWVHIVFSTLLITVQAGILNNMLLKNKAFEENTYIPAFLYVIVMSGIMDFFALSPQLMSLTFLLLALNHIFRRIDNVVSDELFVYSGLYLAIATCFYIPSGIFILIFLLGFILFSSAVARRLFLLLLNTFIVLAGIWIYFYWFRAGWDFVSDFFIVGFTKPVTYYIGRLDLFISGGGLLLAGLIGLMTLFTIRVTNFQLKIQQMMVAFLLAAGIVTFLSVDLMTADLVFFVPPIAFFLTHYLLNLKRKYWKPFMPVFIISMLIAFPVFLIQKGQVDGLIVKDHEFGVDGKSLMGIGIPVSYYQEYKIAGPFLDDYVSRRKLADIDFYDSASEVYEALVKSNPEVVIDHWGEAEKLFFRFPAFGERYEQMDETTYRLKGD